MTAAIEKDISLRTAARHIKQHLDRYAKLTPREREVLRVSASSSAVARAPVQKNTSVGRVAVDGDVFRWVSVFWDY